MFLRICSLDEARKAPWGARLDFSLWRLFRNSASFRSANEGCGTCGAWTRWPRRDCRLWKKVKRVWILDRELGFGSAFEIAPLVADIQHDLVSLRDNLGAHVGFVLADGL